MLLFTVDPFHNVQEVRMAFFFPLQIGSPLCFLPEVVTKVLNAHRGAGACQTLSTNATCLYNTAS